MTDPFRNYAREKRRHETRRKIARAFRQLALIVFICGLGLAGLHLGLNAARIAARDANPATWQLDLINH